MRGLFLRSFRDALGVTWWCALAFFLFEALFVPVTHRFQDQLIGPVLKIDFVRGMMRALLGSDIGASFGSDALAAISWVHPAILALLWAHAIALTTRAPVGAIDRATIDFLLGLPVTRRAYWMAETLALVAATGLLFVAGIAGHVVGGRFIPAEGRMAPAVLAVIVANLAALQGAVVGVTFLVSAASSRRGRAVAVVFGVVLVSFLLGFLAQLWSPARPFAVVSLMTYYRPLAIAQAGAEASLGAAVAWGDLAVLGGFAAATWLGGWLVFSRRDIATI